MFRLSIQSILQSTAGIRTRATVVICFLLFFIPSLASAKLLINEIMWMGSDLSTSDEWVELSRDPQDADCASAMSLSGVTLTVLNSSNVEVPIIRFGSTANLQCGSYLVVSHFTEPSSRLSLDPSYVTTGFSLPNTKLLLRLRDPADNLIDLADDGVGDPMAGLNNTTGGIRASMERVDFALDGGLKANWRTADTTAGFDAGFSNFGTPGFANGGGASSAESSSAQSSAAESSSASFSSAVDSSSSEKFSQQSSVAESSVQHSSQAPASFQPENSSVSSSSVASITSISSFPSFPSIFISEVLPNPVGLDSEEWIEIGNTGSGDADIGGWTLSVSGSTLSYRFPSEQTLPAGRFVSFRKSLTGIVLDNKGKTVVLKNGTSVIDSLMYFEVPEGVSVGRDTTEHFLHAYCVPTENGANVVRLPDAGIIIQSGNTSGEEQVTLNLNTQLETSIQSSAECAWDFGDGFRTTACNPPSHTFEDEGQYTIRLEVRDYCINTVERSLQVHVYEKRNSSSSSRQSTAFSSRSSGSSSSMNTQQQPSAAAGGTDDQDTSAISMVAALPNPSGLDAHQEWVEVENASAVRVSLAGWKLREAEQKKTCALDHIALEPSSKRKVQIDVCKWSLLNTKGTLELHDPSGAIHSAIQWVKALDGKVYVPQKVLASDGTGFAVIRVIDGDTIEIADNKGTKQTVRLLGIDASEIAHGTQAVEPYSDEAKKFLEALIVNKKIELQFDTNKADVFGRMLAFVFTEGKDVQQMMLREGLARVYLRSPSSRESEYLGYEMEARREGKGMWAIAHTPSPRPGTGASEKSITQQQPSVAAGMEAKYLYLSEIYPSPNVSEDEWIELYNPNPVSLSLAGWILDDVKNAGSKPYVFPDGTWINAGESLVMYAQQSGLKLNDDGDEVWLISPDESFPDHMKYDKAKKGLSFSKLNTFFDQNSDESDDGWCTASSPTPGTLNLCNDQNLYSKKGPSSASVSLNSGPRSIGLALRYQTAAEETKTGSGIGAEVMTGALADLRGQILEAESVDTRTSGDPSIGSIVAILSISLIVGMGGLRYLLLS